MKNIFTKLVCFVLVTAAFSSCSDKYLTDMNTDKTKPTTINPTPNSPQVFFNQWETFS